MEREYLLAKCLFEEEKTKRESNKEYNFMKWYEKITLNIT